MSRSSSSATTLCMTWWCCLLSGCATLPAPSQADHDLKVADIELASGAPEAALRIMQDLALQRPDDARVALRLAEANAALGHPQAAEASFQRILANAPRNLQAGFGLARLHLAGDPARALVELQQLATVAPQDARIMTDLGIALDLLGRATEAQEAYHRALILDPALDSTRANLGLSLAISGHPDAALELLAPLALAADAGTRVRHDYALAEALAGHPQQATTLLQRDLPEAQATLALNAYEALGHAPQ